ncbi:hypothetical protein CHO01_22760 [Cellulomonas hominis]|uniref:Tfp pilus assembly protein PilV n=1 Tax=Cellulomonas hominis TaxID=156981 RepID=A0A511FD39_9CELL|nr:hypothetical protein [Cellulomonas hominis]MBB5474606.1 Tfp pilus assembly protein PilV [Cellulomonas hominis]NKY05479.1 hypothetical protein [Cellulomonas hominis]GEL47160.1 hypothetical protein CHO01_22760 [Cellulomonas hominis]
MLPERYRLHDERGGTLVETIISLLLLTIAISFVGGSGLNSLRVQSISDRLATYATATQSIMAKARQADYSDLGFYGDDARATTGTATLPVNDESGAARAEQAVVLGPTRPAATSSFDVAPVETFDADGFTYRVQTWVTAVPPAPGDSVSRARRVVVQGEWTNSGNAGVLDGTCRGADVRCSVQMIVRTASGSDVDPTTGASASSSGSCASATAVVCEGYVRSGLVLDGATMVTDADTARQSSPVDLYARTSVPASAVTATWTYKVTSGATVVERTVTESLTSVDGGTRWSSSIAADGDGTPKRKILPGKVTVTFTATVPGGTAVLPVPAFWTVDRATGSDYDHVTAALEDAAATAWCSGSGAGVPIRVTTTGGSVGMSTTSPTTSGADQAWAAFASRGTDGKVKAVSVPALPVDVAPVTINLSGTVLQAATTTTWQVQAPPTGDCATTSAATLVFARAVDGSTTSLPLLLAHE